MATVLCRRGWMNFKGLPVLAMRFQCKSISSSSNGDELTSVNHANVDCSHDVNRTASVIRDCSPTALLGIKRGRRVAGSLSDVVKRQLTSDAGETNTAEKYVPIGKELKNVEVIYENHWLTFDNDELTFKSFRSAGSRWIIIVFTEDPGHSGPGTPIMFVLQHNPSLALDVTTNDEIIMSPILLMDYRRKNIPGSGLFFKALPELHRSFLTIQSTLTDSYLGVTTKNGTLVPIMSSNPIPIELISGLAIP